VGDAARIFFVRIGSSEASEEIDRQPVENRAFSRFTHHLQPEHLRRRRVPERG
jgi:hypothetical protein